MSYYVNRLDNEAFETLFRLFTIADKENNKYSKGDSND